MKNKSIIVLRLLMTIVLVLIGAGIWLIIKEVDKKEPVPEVVEEKEEALNIHSDLVKNLPYPDMNGDCYFIENADRYQKSLSIEEIELSEKIDTAVKALSDEEETTISASDIRKYMKKYWGIDNYQDFSFSRNDTNYTYNDEDNTYHIEKTDLEQSCSTGEYQKYFFAAPIKATKKGKEITVDYALLYYIKDMTNETVYHFYQDSSFTRYIETQKDADNVLEEAISKNQATLEQYRFHFVSDETDYHFKDSKQIKGINSLKEVEESQLENINLFTNNNLCVDFDEESMYQKERFTPSDLESKDRLFLAFYFANQNDKLGKEPTVAGMKKEYTFTKEEVESIYNNLWQSEDELVDFEYFGYQGTASENEYKLVINERNQTCGNTRKYVEMKVDHIYQDGDNLYVDYKIRFIDKKGNLINIYQDKNYNNVLKEKVRSNNIQEEYWDLEYVTYRYVYKKQGNGTFYFLEGLYI